MREVTRNTNIAVGTDSVTLSEAVSPNAVRTAIVITNTSTAGQYLTVNFGDGDAVATYGIVLAPYGSWAETEDARFTPSQARISIISSAALGTVAVHERQRIMG